MAYQHSVSFKRFSACVVENLCCHFKQSISYEKTKLKNICDWMVDFCRPGHIYRVDSKQCTPLHNKTRLMRLTRVRYIRNIIL